jgi:hypothetical protein
MDRQTDRHTYIHTDRQTGRHDEANIRVFVNAPKTNNQSPGAVVGDIAWYFGYRGFHYPF